MKSLVFTACILLFSCVVSAHNEQTYEEIPLQVTIDDPTIQHGPIRRTPILTPAVSIEGHILHFNTSCNGCTLQLLDKKGEVQYDIVILEDTTSINLPTSLEGEFKIQIIRGKYRFYGFINI